MRCGKERLALKHLSFARRNPHECAVAKAKCIADNHAAYASQPARMRCGKADLEICQGESFRVATRTNALWQRFTAKDGLNACRVATRTNALWQSCLQTSLQDTHKSQPARMRCGKELGNRQGAVHCAVATRANALWQSGLSCSSCLQAAVATRANALWQRQQHLDVLPIILSQPARIRCGKDHALTDSD